MPTVRDKTSIPTRRRALAAIGAATLLPGAAGATTQDEPLVAMWAEYNRLEMVCREACKKANEAAECAISARPARPRSLYTRRYGSTEKNLDHPDFKPLTAALLNTWRANAIRNGTPVKTYDRRLKDLEEWEASCAGVDAARGVTELNEIADQASGLVERAKEKIVDTSPRTARGILIKLQLADAVMGYSDPDMYETLDVDGRVILALIQDLKKLA